MTNKESNLIKKHLEKHLHAKEDGVLQPGDIAEYHIDCLLYKPTEEYPFWKLVTMGASDYLMPKGHSIARRNEYMMFIEDKEDLYDESLLKYYYDQLMNVAYSPIDDHSLLSYGHNITWLNSDFEMCGVYINLPTIFDHKILRLKLGFNKEIAFLEVVLLNKDDLKKLKEMGNERFSYYLSSDDGSVNHFLSQKHRTDAF